MGRGVLSALGRKWGRGVRKSLLAQEEVRGWKRPEGTGWFSGCSRWATSRGHLPAEGRRGEGRRSPPGTPSSGRGGSGNTRLARPGLM